MMSFMNFKILSYYLNARIVRTEYSIPRSGLDNNQDNY